MIQDGDWHEGAFSVIASRLTFNPPTAERAAAYREHLKTVDGGVYWPRQLQLEGKLTKAQADEQVKQARTQRRLRKSLNRRKP